MKRRRLKIAFVAQPLDGVIPPHQNSIGLLIYEASKSLARDFDITVFMPQQDTQESQAFEINKINYKRFTLKTDTNLHRLWHRMPFFNRPDKPFFSSKLFYFWYGLRVALEIKKHDFDVVQVFNFSQFVPMVRFFNRTTKISLYMLCDWLVQLNRQMLVKRLDSCDSIIGCSKYIRDGIINRFPEFANKCTFVWEARDINRFKPSTEKNKEKDFTLLYVGRVSPEKGVHLLLEAMPKTLNDYPKTKLVVVGARSRLPAEFLMSLNKDERIAQELKKFYENEKIPSYPYYLDQRVAELGIEDSVDFKGSIPQTEVPGYYQQATVVIFPSIWNEPGGNPPAEAMASAVPVITTRVGGVPEKIDDGITGLLVEPGNVADLENAISRLLGDEKNRKKIGAAGRLSAEKKFSNERLARDLKYHYEILTGVVEDGSKEYTSCQYRFAGI